jgi:hypothetical protein
MTVLLLLRLTDDIQTHSVLCYFKGRGYEADLARSGPECAAKLRALAPDVFALNAVPGPDGEAAANDGEAPFLFILGEAAPGDGQSLTSTATARYLETPVELRTLLRTVRSLQAHTRAPR